MRLTTQSPGGACWGSSHIAADDSSQSLGETHLQPFRNSEIPSLGQKGELSGWKWLPFKHPSFTANTKVVSEPSGLWSFHCGAVRMLMLQSSWCLTRHCEEGSRSSSGEIFLITEAYFDRLHVHKIQSSTRQVCSLIRQSRFNLCSLLQIFPSSHALLCDVPSSLVGLI